MAENIITIEQYLKGKVRNIDIPDNALSAIILDAGCGSVEVEKEVTDEETGETSIEVVMEPVTKDTGITLLSIKERELCLAWLYVWVAGSPTQTGSTKDADGDWEHSDGGERMSATVLTTYLRMANTIFDKYELPVVGSNKWGFKGSGFRKIRRYPE